MQGRATWVAAYARNFRGCRLRRMWSDPYLETCCRSALHRLSLAGPIGRPPALKDGPCLERLAGMGLARTRPDGRFEITEPGQRTHRALVGA